MRLQILTGAVVAFTTASLAAQAPTPQSNGASQTPNTNGTVTLTGCVAGSGGITTGPFTLATMASGATATYPAAGAAGTSGVASTGAASSAGATAATPATPGATASAAGSAGAATAPAPAAVPNATGTSGAAGQPGNSTGATPAGGAATPSTPSAHAEGAVGTSGRAPTTNYRLTGNDMSAWVGQRVQIVGMLAPPTVSSSSTGAANSVVSMQEFRVQSVMPADGQCPQ